MGHIYKVVVPLQGQISTNISKKEKKINFLRRDKPCMAQVIIRDNSFGRVWSQYWQQRSPRDAKPMEIKKNNANHSTPLSFTIAVQSSTKYKQLTLSQKKQKITRWLYSVAVLCASKPSAICELAVYFLHLTWPSVTWLSNRSSLAACDWLRIALYAVRQPMSDVAENLGEVSCMEHTGQENDFELIPTVKMEKTSHRGITW